MHDELQRLLQSRRTEDRLKAIRLMGAEPTLLDVPALLRLTADRSQLVAARAVRLLADQGVQQAVPELIARYVWLQENGPERDPGCTVRCEIVRALGLLAPRSANDVLRVALRTVQIEAVSGGPEDTATGLRANAALALANTGDPRVVTDLAIMLFDFRPNTSVPPSEAPYAKAATRAAAAKALGRLGDPAAEPLLAVKLAHPHGEVPEVLVECMDALVALGSERAVDLIAPLLEHKEPYVVAGAATALAATGRAEVVDILQRAVSLAVRDARPALVLAFAALRSNAALQALVAFLADPDARVRAAAEQALESFPEHEVEQALAEHPNPSIQARRRRS